MDSIDTDINDVLSSSGLVRPITRERHKCCYVDLDNEMFIFRHKTYKKLTRIRKSL